jgi:ribonucleoside-diphosphate reductase beta chain
MILDPGFNLTLRPMKYPELYDMYRNAIKNTWTVEEVEFSLDLVDMREKLTDAEKFLIHRLVAFFATGDSIVSNNLVLNLYKHINSPEARLYLSRQLFEEATHVQFYLTLLDSYVPDVMERQKAFSAIDNIPSIHKKAEFSFKWTEQAMKMERLETREDRKKFLLNLISFAACNEGLFFFAAFAYVYFLRSKGLLSGLASGTNWVFRDESMHMNFAFQIIDIVRKEEPGLFDQDLENQVTAMMKDAVDCETQFAIDVLQKGVTGLSTKDMRTYLECVADQRLQSLKILPIYHSKNPFSFLELQDLQELTNFFERRVSAYQVAVDGKFSLGEDF